MFIIGFIVCAILLNVSGAFAVYYNNCDSSEQFFKASTVYMLAFAFCVVFGTEGNIPGILSFFAVGILPLYYFSRLLVKTLMWEIKH